MTATITRREAEILAAYGTGMTKKQIGAALYLTENTVKTHMYRICKRLGVNRSWLAVQRAQASGWLDGIVVPLIPAPRPRPHRLSAARRKPAPPAVAVRYLSTTWGEDEWVKALQDDDLYFRILRGIGRAASRKKTP